MSDATDEGKACPIPHDGWTCFLGEGHKGSCCGVPSVAIRYRNWRGEVATRRIAPTGVRWGSNEWHPEPQWLLDAIDVDKGEPRTFALAGVLAWGDATDEQPEIDRLRAEGDRLADCLLGFERRAKEAEDRADRLAEAIRAHRDQRGDDRCWEDDLALYRHVGDDRIADNRVGDKESMLANCRRFVENRCAGGGWPSYAELEAALRPFADAGAKIATAFTDDLPLVASSAPKSHGRDRPNVGDLRRAAKALGAATEARGGEPAGAGDPFRKLLGIAAAIRKIGDVISDVRRGRLLVTLADELAEAARERSAPAGEGPLRQAVAEAVANLYGLDGSLYADRRYDDAAKARAEADKLRAALAAAHGAAGDDHGSEGRQAKAADLVAQAIIYSHQLCSRLDVLDDKDAIQQRDWMHESLVEALETLMPPALLAAPASEKKPG